jgi:uncharacterized protein
MYDFLEALEASGSVSTATGWMPSHIAVRDASGSLLAVTPAYIKSHSYGEYVFDHSWANLHAQLGRRYYPKLQCCVPFTPVPGCRVLVARGADEGRMRATVLAALPQVANTLQV